ncbi:MAG: fused MFS/spermidine synthase [Armatimonadetes bacterium]|nr:fused MFS/spermidine synthase [Armatimonadota bacterium]
MSKAVFVLAILTSAFLLFLVQPMFARMALPYLGGSPAVWNTALVFYQGTLLLGYWYSHKIASRTIGTKWVWAHVALLLLVLASLPIQIRLMSEPPTTGSPVFWLLGILALGVGLPFFAVSTTSPLLQRWFSATGHPQASNPYFLYAASNIGSLLALIGYPTVVERFLTLRQQGTVWTAGYIATVVLVAACAFNAQRGTRPEPSTDSPDAEVVSAGRIGRWVLLAFVPSALLMGVTTYITTEIAAVPLLWVGPLAIYLLTFIIAFSGKGPSIHRWVIVVFPAVLVWAIVATIGQWRDPKWLPSLAGVLGLFVCSLFCHGELAKDKPSPAKLTDYFLWISVGGVLGGLFCGLVAPLVFKQVLEYPIALVLCAFLIRKSDHEAVPAVRWLWLGVTTVAGIGLMLLTQSQGAPESVQKTAWYLYPLALFAVASLVPKSKPRVVDSIFVVAALAAGILGLVWLKSANHWQEHLAWQAMWLAGMAALLSYGRPSMFATATAGLGFLPLFFGPVATSRTYQSRSFFGTLIVRDNGTTRTLGHGTTLHGQQFTNPAFRGLAISYYDPSGPVGDVFLKRRLPTNAKVGLTGLGIGTILSYGKPAQEWTIFEIDPDVVKVASDPKYFTYLSNATCKWKVELGDARLNLSRSKEMFDLLIMDAYSSDSVPVHLITKEAFEVYLSRLKPGGMLVVHISNRYMTLQPVVASIARDLGLYEERRFDEDDNQSLHPGKTPSDWTVSVRRKEDLGGMLGAPGWGVDEVPPGFQTWTDDRTSVLAVIKWARWKNPVQER